MELGLTGFVMNLPDGRVYCEAEGEEENLDELEQWFFKGSPFSNVTSIEVESQELSNFTKFEVRYDS